MAVRGAARVQAHWRRIPVGLEKALADEVAHTAGHILEEMRRLTPLDASHTGPHARDGLTIMPDKGGLRSWIGLPLRSLAEKYFWFRFLDQGTRGGVVRVRRKGRKTDTTRQVRPRPALRIRARALDAHGQIFRDAILTALRRSLSSGKS